MNLREIKDRLRDKKFMRPVLWVWRCIYRFMRMIQRIRNQIYGYFLFRKIITTREDIYIMAWHSIGDTLYSMANIEALHDMYPDKKIIVIGYDKRAELLKSFSHIDKLIILPEKKFFALFEVLISNYFNGFMLRQLGDINILRCMLETFPYYQAHKNTTCNMEQIHVIRKMLGIPYDAPVTYHGIKQSAVESIKNFSEIKNRIAVINPYSTSMITTMKIYECICEKLTASGYIVFTNIVNGQQAVKGSIALNCSLHEFYSIACNIPLVVSVRSGILDFIMPSGVSMFVIYDETGDEETLKRLRFKKFKSAGIEIVFGDKYKLKAENRLDGWKSKCKIREVLVEDPNDITPVLDSFDSFLRELKAEGKIS